MLPVVSHKTRGSVSTGFDRLNRLPRRCTGFPPANPSPSPITPGDERSLSSAARSNSSVLLIDARRALFGGGIGFSRPGEELILGSMGVQISVGERGMVEIFRVDEIRVIGGARGVTNWAAGGASSDALLCIAERCAISAILEPLDEVGDEREGGSGLAMDRI